MLRRYCFLVGTSFSYYSTQEDAYHMLRLKGEVDVLGVQEWDGKGNMHIYQNGFLFATAQNKVFYAYADTAMEKEKWMRAIQMTVETSMPRMSPSWASHGVGIPQWCCASQRSRWGHVQMLILQGWRRWDTRSSTSNNAVQVPQL